MRQILSACHIGGVLPKGYTEVRTLQKILIEECNAMLHVSMAPARIGMKCGRQD